MRKKRLSKNQIDTLFDQILNQGKSGMDVYEEIRPESKCSDFPEEVHPDPVSEDITHNVTEPEVHPPEIPEHVQTIIDELAKAPRSFFTFEEVADSLPRQNREKVIHNCEALIDNEHPQIESMWWEGKEMIGYRTNESKIISVGSIEVSVQSEAMKTDKTNR